MIISTSSATLDAQPTVLAVNEQRLFTIRGVDYLAVPEPNSFILLVEGDRPEQQLTPLTVLRPSLDDPISASSLQALTQDTLRHDDVWTPDFLRGILIISDHDPAISWNQLSSAFGTKWIWWSSSSGPAGSLSPGPFVLWRNELCRAHRVYDDVQASFVVATKPQNQERARQFEPLRLSGRYYTSLAVAVPTRVQLHKDNDRPLAGVRFAIKDLFRIKGLRPTLGDRAYYSMSPTADSTSPLIQQLIDAGADLVGTLKLASLITKEEPTEAQDFHAASNPRADGYQSAWSSSGGSGAAIASYDWLDFTLGSDTTGSSRRPAMANGVFQLRFSAGGKPVDGMIPAWWRFDAPAMYVRDITRLEAWATVCIDPKHAAEQKVQRSVSIIVPTDFPVQNETQRNLIDRFVSDLETATGTTRRTVSLRDLWKKSPPRGAPTKDLAKFLEPTGVNGFCRGFLDEHKSFLEEYRAKTGRAAYSNPTVLYRLRLARDVTDDQHADAVARLDMYKAWLLEQVLEVEKDHLPLVILPITTQAVDYRDVAPPPPAPPVAYDGIWMAPVLGSPELSVPIGELKFYSERSLRDEYLPVVASVLSAPGRDIALVNTVRNALERVGRPTEVFTGRRMFVQEHK